MINSTNNQQIKLLKKLLSDKKYRKENNLYVIEGERLVKEAIKYNKEIVNIFVAESKVDKYQSFGEHTVVSDSVLNSISDTVNSQGIMATVVLPISSSKVTDGNVLVLENLQDAGNIGTLLRSAVANDITQILLVNCVDVYNEKVIRSAMSAHFVANFIIVDTIQDAFAMLDGKTVICADMGGVDVQNYNTRGEFALILGNEGNGVSEFSKQNSNILLSLKMKNNIESLNVAVAGSTLMYLLSN